MMNSTSFPARATRSHQVMEREDPSARNLSRRRSLAVRFSRFTIVLACIHEYYMRPLGSQFVKNQRGARPRSLPASKRFYRPLAILDRIRPAALINYKISMCIYSILLVKYTLVEIMSHSGILERYQWLDCCLLGRFRFIGRTNKISGELAIWALLVFMTHRLVCGSSFAENFRFHFVEFMWHDLEEVEQIELHDQYRRDMDDRQPSVQQGHGTRDGYENESENGRKRAISSSLDEGHMRDWPAQHESGLKVPLRGARYNPLFHIRCGLARSKHTGGLLLRLNRTSTHWRKLHRLNSFMLPSLIWALLFWLVLLSYLVGGSILTNTGFELAYSSCAAWLRDQQHANRSAYSSIYRAPLVLAGELPLQDLQAITTVELDRLPPITSYYLVRVLFDSVECLILYYEFVLYVLFTCQLVILASIDVIHNAQQVRCLVQNVTDKLESRQIELPLWDTATGREFIVSGTAGQRGRSASVFPSQRGRIRRQDDRKLRREIIQLQTILGDHFQLIVSYNAFVAYVLLLPIFCWLSYTTIICIWMGQIRTRAIEIEFILAETAAVLMSFMTLSTAAIARSHNKNLYPLITRLMALDQTSSYSEVMSAGHPGPITKLRWIAVLRYYFPKPTFCFALFGSMQVSWFFCLKVSVDIDRCLPLVRSWIGSILTCRPLLNVNSDSSWPSGLSVCS